MEELIQYYDELYKKGVEAYIKEYEKHQEAKKEIERLNRGAE